MNDFRFLSDVTIALNACQAVEASMNEWYGIKKSEEAEYLKAHVKNKNAVKALCYELLGSIFPPENSNVNPFEFYPRAHDSEAEHLLPIHDIMRSYGQSDGKMRVKGGNIEYASTTWTEKVAEFIRKHMPLLPKPSPQVSSNIMAL